ncbi:unnamed protein product, partial [marine sediment metagenome]
SDEVKRNIQSFAGMQGKLFYFWNANNNPNFEVRNIPYIAPTLRIRDKNEVFHLGEPALFWDGIPVFVVVRGIPFSLTLDLSKVNVWDKNKSLIIPKGLSSDEIDAKIHSLYVNRIFRQHTLTPIQMFMIILLMIVCCLTTYLIFSWWT